MLTLEQIKDWLKSQDTDLKDCIAVGSIDGNKDKFVGVYPLKPSGSSQRICLGGVDQTRYGTAWASILIHWTNKMSTAEAKATAIYGLFYGLSDVMMGTAKVISADPGPAPIPVGKDAHGVCEYVIQIKFIKWLILEYFPYSKISLKSDPRAKQALSLPIWLPLLKWKPFRSRWMARLRNGRQWNQKAG